MKIIYARFTNESPNFFKKVIKIGLAAGAVGAALLSLPASLAAAGVAVVVPGIVGTIGSFLTTSGVVASIIAKLTVADPDTLPKKEDKK